MLKTDFANAVKHVAAESSQCLFAGAAFLSTAAQSLLKALLEREPAKRLGSGPQGSEAVMAHPFFRPISWARLLRREVRLGAYKACSI